MSSASSGVREGSLNDLLEMRARFEELKKEKETFRDSKSQPFELIKRLESHVRTLSKVHEEDKKHIEELERELSNCCQEIDYLQDQLNIRDSDLNCLVEQVSGLQLKLADMDNLAEEAERLREQMRISESEKSLLMQEIEEKEVVIRYSASRVEELEESISSFELEFQCEIETTKLESMAFEQNLLEVQKLLDERTQENSRMDELIQDLEFQIQDANTVIESLHKENRDLRESQQMSDTNSNAFVKKLEEQFDDRFDINDNECSTLLQSETSSAVADADLRKKIAEMSRKMEEDENLVKQLKEELRKERLKSKEEAEDLTQEMAELRYQLMAMLDEERKRRANVEQLSLQRITELEAQIGNERQNSIIRQDIVMRKW